MFIYLVEKIKIINQLRMYGGIILIIYYILDIQYWLINVLFIVNL